METTPYTKKSTKAIKIINIILSITVVILLLILLTLLFIVSPKIVNGISMENTFQNGDHIFILKIGYKYTYGDIVVFEREDDKALIKRIIGLPGDVIKFDTAKNCWIRNDEILQEDYTKELSYNSNYFSSTSQNLDVHTLLITTGITVGEDELFVLGDNRNNSKDSHCYGCIKKDMLIGKYVFKY